MVSARRHEFRHVSDSGFRATGLLRQWHAERDDWLRRHDVEPNAIDWKTRLAAQPGLEREFNAKFNNKLKLHQDYRKLLEQEKPDVVTIGTPDYWHVPIANRPQRREPECGDGVPVPQDLPDATPVSTQPDRGI